MTDNQEDKNIIHLTYNIIVRERGQLRRHKMDNQTKEVTLEATNPMKVLKNSGIAFPNYLLDSPVSKVKVFARIEDIVTAEVNGNSVDDISVERKIVVSPVLYITVPTNADFTETVTYIEEGPNQLHVYSENINYEDLEISNSKHLKIEKMLGQCAELSDTIELSTQPIADAANEILNNTEDASAMEDFEDNLEEEDDVDLEEDDISDGLDYQQDYEDEEDEDVLTPEMLTQMSDKIERYHLKIEGGLSSTSIISMVTVEGEDGEEETYDSMSLNKVSTICDEKTTAQIVDFCYKNLVEFCN